MDRKGKVTFKDDAVVIEEDDQYIPLIDIEKDVYGTIDVGDAFVLHPDPYYILRLVGRGIGEGGEILLNTRVNAQHGVHFFSEEKFRGMVHSLGFQILTEEKEDEPSGTMLRFVCTLRNKGKDTTGKFKTKPADFDWEYFTVGQEIDCRSNYGGYSRFVFPMDLDAEIYLERYLDGDVTKKVLDAGCARGILVAAFRKIGVDAYGIDFSKYAVNNPDEEFVAPYIKWGDIRKISYSDSRFHLVLCLQTLEHVPEAGIAVEELLRVGGIVGVATPTTRTSDDHDTTHYTIMTVPEWDMFFYRRDGWRLNGRYPLCSYMHKDKIGPEFWISNVMRKIFTQRDWDFVEARGLRVET